MDPVTSGLVVGLLIFLGLLSKAVHSALHVTISIYPDLIVAFKGLTYARLRREFYALVASLARGNVTFIVGLWILLCLVMLERQRWRGWEVLYPYDERWPIWVRKVRGLGIKMPDASDEERVPRHTYRVLESELEYWQNRALAAENPSHAAAAMDFSSKSGEYEKYIGVDSVQEPRNMGNRRHNDGVPQVRAPVPRSSNHSSHDKQTTRPIAEDIPKTKSGQSTKSIEEEKRTKNDEREARMRQKQRQKENKADRSGRVRLRDDEVRLSDLD